MRKNNGFIELTLLIYAAVAAAAVAGVMYLMHLGAANERAAQVTANAAAQAKRTELISGLAIDLSSERQKGVDERRQADTQRQEQQTDYEKRLHEFVPSGTSCVRAGFVRYTDAAAAGVPLVPGPQPGPADAPAAVGDDVEAGIIVRNYARYHVCEARLAGILNEFDALRTTFNAKVNQMNAKPP